MGIYWLAYTGGGTNHIVTMVITSNIKNILYSNFIS